MHIGSHEMSRDPAGVDLGQRGYNRRAMAICSRAGAASPRMYTYICYNMTWNMDNMDMDMDMDMG